MNRETHPREGQDNLDLRSEKARRFIRQKPSRLVLMGTWAMTLVILALSLAFYAMRFRL